MGQTSIISVGRTPMSFEGIIFTGAVGTTGAAVYGEARMSFTDSRYATRIRFEGRMWSTTTNGSRTDACIVLLRGPYSQQWGDRGDMTYAVLLVCVHRRFVENESEVDAAAVMVMRTASFTRCEFEGNTAKYAGAVRISDIGGAEFEDCHFLGNTARSVWLPSPLLPPAVLCSCSASVVTIHSSCWP